MFDVSTQQTKKRMNKKEFRKATFADFFEVKSKLPGQNYEAEVGSKHREMNNYKLSDRTNTKTDILKESSPSRPIESSSLSQLLMSCIFKGGHS